MEDYNARATPWMIDEADFASSHSLKDKAKFLLSYAVLAPSGHNTQPWQFGLTDDGVLVYADYSRRLPVANPDDRELIMSVATAITNLRIAAAHFGLACDVRYLPEPDKKDLLASVRLSEGQVDHQMADLFPAILTRWTNRFAYDDKKISEADLEELGPFTTLGSASLKMITDEAARGKLADIVSQGDLVRMADKAFTRELSEWIRPDRSTKTDGMLAEALGIPPLVGGIAPWVVRTFNSSKSQAKKESALARNAAALVVLHGTDEKQSLLEAGELLERFILKLTFVSMFYSFFNLPVELDDLRAKIKSLAGIDDEPQLLLRIGYGAAPKMDSPRRLVKDVLKG
jgi:hypothetical protein